MVSLIIGIFVALCITLTAANENYEDWPIRRYHGLRSRPYDNQHETAQAYDDEWEINNDPEGWHNPRFSMKPARASRSQEARRRPLFYPIMPYHPFYPHAQPSQNDKEFETIESKRNYHGSYQPKFPFNYDIQKNMKESRNPFYYGSYSPYTLNSDRSEKRNEYVPISVHHGHYKPNIYFYDQYPQRNNKFEHHRFSQHGFHIPHFPLFNPFYKKPGASMHHNFKSDFPTPHKVHHHHKPELNEEKDHENSSNITSNEEIAVGSSSVQELDHNHGNHDTDHHSHGKPHDEETSIETSHLDTEGSEEDEIIPLSEVHNEIPLQKGDEEDINEENKSDTAPAFSLRNLLVKT